MKMASITEAKNNLSALIDRVKNGASILIVDRGRPVARLEPVRGAESDDDDGRLARLVRDGVVVYEGQVSSLRRFAEDVREVAAGFECGIGISDYRDLKEGDVIEVYERREVARTA